MRCERKKTIVFIIFFMFVIVNLASVHAEYLRYLNADQECNENNSKTISTSKKWTFLAYLDGDVYDIEKSMIIYINNMELIGSTSNVNIVVQADDCGSWGDQTRRYYIVKDDNLDFIASPLADNDTSEKDMGDPQTLIDFVCWGIDNYPAENYCLTIYNHGSGWQGICSDQTNGASWMNMSELKQAMMEINNHLSAKLDVLILNACKMGMIEVFYPIKNYVDIIVASEQPTSRYDMSYIGILENLTEQPLLTPSEFTQIIVDTSYNSFNGIQTHKHFGIYLDKIDAITEKVDILAQALISNMPHRLIINAAYTYSISWNGIQIPPYPHDILRFAEKISDLAYDNDIKKKANELINIVKDSVIRPQEDDDNYVDPRLNGISIYFPPKKSVFQEIYREQEFAKDTYWDELLDAFYRIGLNSGQQNSVQSSSTQIISSPGGKSAQKARSNLFSNINLASMFEKLFRLIAGFPNYTDWYKS